MALFVLTVRARRTVLDAHRLIEDVTRLEEQVDSVRRLAKRIVARDNMRDYRERAADEPAKRKRPNGAAPDWRTDPNEFIRHHEARLGISRRSIPE